MLITPTKWLGKLGERRVKTMIIFIINEESKDLVFVARAILKMESMNELK